MGTTDAGDELLGFDEARARILANARRVGAERVPVAGAAGRVVAEDLVAHEPLPRFDNSAMDGYAIALADLAGPGPWTLDVAGESSAGSAPSWLAHGAACRIFTGAPVPERADAVIMQEHVTREGDEVRFATRPRPGQNVRRAGEDLARDAVALAAGTRLGAGGLALAAMLGQSEIAVARRPVVTIVCTGDERRRAPRCASRRSRATIRAPRSGPSSRRSSGRTSCSPSAASAWATTTSCGPRSSAPA
jgi:molybdopterin molybdotransferase